jgi:hypothetical protein
MDRLTQGSRVLCIRQDRSPLVLSLHARAHKTGAALLQLLVIRNYPQLQARRISRRSRFPYRVISWAAVALIGVALLGIGRIGLARESNAAFDAMIARHAKANDVPESLIRRVIWRESKYNPGLVGRGNAMGLMQIKPATAREVGYTGSASGLLDAETNMKYATRYLAGAYRVAGGNADRAVSLYAKGYYFEAKRRGMLAMMDRYRRGSEPAETRQAAAEENPARHAASFQLASAEPVVRDAAPRIIPGARAVTTETIRKDAFVPEPSKSRDREAAERTLRLALAPAVPLPREKPLRLASARTPVTMRDVAAVRSIPAREAVSARQLSAAREAAAIAPDSFASGELFVPHATPVMADATPRYTTAAVRTLSDLPPSPHVLDQNKIAAVEPPAVVERAPAPPPAPRIAALAQPVGEPVPAITPAAKPVAPAQTSIAPRPIIEPVAPAAAPQQPGGPAALLPAKPVQEEAPVAQQKREEKVAKRERRSHRVARVQRQPAAAPTPLGWLQQQFASLGRSLNGPQQRPSRRASAQ